MAIPWSDVEKTPDFQKLDAAGKAAARDQYFNQVVAPNVPKEQLSVAKDQFYAHAALDAEPKKKPFIMKEEKPYNPTDDMSTLDKLRAGMGKAFVDVGRGAGQLVGAVSNEDVADSRKRDAALMQTGAGMTGNIAGNVAAAVPLSFIPGANTMAGSALIGAGMGAVQPSTSGTERMENAVEGGAMSGTMTAAMRALPALKRALVDPFTDAGQKKIALNALMQFSKDPKSIGAATGKDLIPGSKQTLAEITGDPGIAQLQRAAQVADPGTASAFAEARTARLAARKEALQNIAGTEGKMEFFQMARDTAAEKDYAKAWKKGIDQKKMTPKLQTEVAELMDRPSINAARKEAQSMAREEGTTLADAELGSVKGLHYTKKALDAQISAAKGANDNDKVRLLSATKDKLLSTIDKLSPAYAEARAQYAAASKPINAMQIGDYMYKKLVPALTDLGAERITPAQYAKTLQEGDAMAAKATGFKGAKLRDILTDEDMHTLINMGKDLAGEAKAFENAKVGGSPTAQYLTGRNTLASLMEPTGIPKGLASTVGADVLSNRWVSAAAKPVESKVQGKLAEFLLDPSKAKEAQAEMLAKTKKMAPISELMRRAVPSVSLGTSAYANEQ